MLQGDAKKHENEKSIFHLIWISFSDYAHAKRREYDLMDELYVLRDLSWDYFCRVYGKY